MSSTWDSLRQHLEEYITKVKATAKVRTNQGVLVEPPIFANDIFNSTKWTSNRENNMDESLFYQMRRSFGGDAVDEYLTVSPYFDKSFAVLDAVVAECHAKAITIITQRESTTLDGQALERWHARHKSVKLQVKLIDFPKEERFRPLHAKMHVLRRGRHLVWLAGSANCTRAAMLGDCRTGNLEVGRLVNASDSSLLESILACGAASLAPAGNLAELGQQATVPPVRSQFPLRLGEVLYEQDKLRVTVEVLNQVAGEKFHLELDGFLGKKEHTRSIPLAADFTKPQFVPLAGDVGLQQLLESTAVKARILLLAAGNRQPVSGWRWVENIDVDGQSVRIARAIRDAEKTRRSLPNCCRL